MARPYHYTIDSEAVIVKLNQILEVELAGTVRFTHYSFMIFGYSRIPIVSWFRAQAKKTILHAQQAGELVTHLGGHPSGTNQRPLGADLTLHYGQLKSFFLMAVVFVSGDRLLLH